MRFFKAQGMLRHVLRLLELNSLKYIKNSWLAPSWISYCFCGGSTTESCIKPAQRPSPRGVLVGGSSVASPRHAGKRTGCWLFTSLLGWRPRRCRTTMKQSRECDIGRRIQLLHLLSPVTGGSVATGLSFFEAIRPAPGFADRQACAATRIARHLARAGPDAGLPQTGWSGR